MSSFSKIPIFSKEDFDYWKIRMQAHLSALDDDMWFVIIDGPLTITKINTVVALSGGSPQYIEKPRIEWTAEDKKKANLENVAINILYKTLDKNTFSKIKMCKTGKEIWEKLIQLCEGNEQTKENKLSVSTQRFDNIRMKPGESMAEFDERVSSIVIELNALGKTYPNREVILKVIRGLPKELNVKTMAMIESKDLNKLELHDLFADLKAYEFELQTREEDQSTSQLTKALTTVKIESPIQPEKTAEQLSSDSMSLFVKKFGKFIRRNQEGSYKRRMQSKNQEVASIVEKTGHFIADCSKTKRDEQTSTERWKKKFERRKHSRDAKYTSRNKHEALVAEDSKAKWAETDSESDKSKYSSSTSDDDEEVKCLMANDHEQPSTSEHVFDFSSEDFTREDLIKALHDMANEYHQLSIAFDEVRAKQDQIDQMNRKRFGIGFNPQETKVETAKSPERTNAYQPNPMRETQGQYHNQLLVQKRYRKFKDIGKGKQHMVSQANRTPQSRAHNLVRTYRNTDTGKLVKVFQVKGTKEKSGESWYLDSGCLRHKTGNNKLLSELTKYNGPTITFGDNSQGRTMGKGKIIHERRNRTLKNAARTKLADSKVSQRFWAEAGNTACYTQNISMIFDGHESERPVDTQQTHLVEAAEEPQFEAQERFLPNEGTEFGQDNMPDQAQEDSVNNENHPAPNLKWSKKHPLKLVIGNPTEPVKTRGKMIKELLYKAFISQIEPKKIDDALADSC
ncbi:uncharacterized protein [Henckelia pumila]|uniref:uncharacterized protein n=1 Tax=Henckelia pumila TaxID=405737 RepID=UPI003C6E981F